MSQNSIIAQGHSRKNLGRSESQRSPELKLNLNRIVSESKNSLNSSHQAHFKRTVQNTSFQQLPKGLFPIETEYTEKYSNIFNLPSLLEKIEKKQLLLIESSQAKLIELDEIQEILEEQMQTRKDDRSPERSINTVIYKESAQQNRGQEQNKKQFESMYRQTANQAVRALQIQNRIRNKSANALGVQNLSRQLNSRQANLASAHSLNQFREIDSRNDTQLEGGDGEVSDDSSPSQKQETNLSSPSKLQEPNYRTESSMIDAISRMNANTSQVDLKSRSSRRAGNSNSRERQHLKKKIQNHSINFSNQNNQGLFNVPQNRIAYDISTLNIANSAQRMTSKNITLNFSQSTSQINRPEYPEEACDVDADEADELLSDHASQINLHQNNTSLMNSYNPSLLNLQTNQGRSQDAESGHFEDIQPPAQSSFNDMMKQVIQRHNDGADDEVKQPNQIAMTSQVMVPQGYRLAIQKTQQQPLTDRHQQSRLRNVSEGYFSPNETVIERKMVDHENQSGMIIGIKSFIEENLDVLRQLNQICKEQKNPLKNQIQILTRNLQEYENEIENQKNQAQSHVEQIKSLESFLRTNEKNSSRLNLEDHKNSDMKLKAWENEIRDLQDKNQKKQFDIDRLTQELSDSNFQKNSAEFEISKVQKEVNLLYQSLEDYAESHFIMPLLPGFDNVAALDSLKEIMKENDKLKQNINQIVSATLLNYYSFKPDSNQQQIEQILKELQDIHNQCYSFDNQTPLEDTSLVSDNSSIQKLNTSPQVLNQTKNQSANKFKMVQKQYLKKYHEILSEARQQFQNDLKGVQADIAQNQQKFEVINLENQQMKEQISLVNEENKKKYMSFQVEKEGWQNKLKMSEKVHLVNQQQKQEIESLQLAVEKLEGIIVNKNSQLLKMGDEIKYQHEKISKFEEEIFEFQSEQNRKKHFIQELENKQKLLNEQISSNKQKIFELKNTIQSLKEQIQDGYMEDILKEMSAYLKELQVYNDNYLENQELVNYLAITATNQMGFSLGRDQDVISIIKQLQDKSNSFEPYRQKMKTTILYLDKKIQDYKLLLKERSNVKKRRNLNKSNSFSPMPSKRTLNQTSSFVSRPSVVHQDSDEDSLPQKQKQIRHQKSTGVISKQDTLRLDQTINQNLMNKIDIAADEKLGLERQIKSFKQYQVMYEQVKINHDITIEQLNQMKSRYSMLIDQVKKHAEYNCSNGQEISTILKKFANLSSFIENQKMTMNIDLKNKESVASPNEINLIMMSDSEMELASQSVRSINQRSERSLKRDLSKFLSNGNRKSPQKQSHTFGPGQLKNLLQSREKVDIETQTLSNIGQVSVSCQTEIQFDGDKIQVQFIKSQALLIEKLLQKTKSEGSSVVVLSSQNGSLSVISQNAKKFRKCTQNHELKKVNFEVNKFGGNQRHECKNSKCNKSIDHGYQMLRCEQCDENYCLECEFEVVKGQVVIEIDKQYSDSNQTSNYQGINGPPDQSQKSIQFEQSSERVQQVLNVAQSQTYNTLQVERQQTDEGEVQEKKDIQIQSSYSSMQTNDGPQLQGKKFLNTKLEDRLKQFEKKFEVVQSQLQSSNQNSRKDSILVGSIDQDQIINQLMSLELDGDPFNSIQQIILKRASTLKSKESNLPQKIVNTTEQYREDQVDDQIDDEGPYLGGDFFNLDEHNNNTQEVDFDFTDPINEAIHEHSSNQECESEDLPQPSVLSMQKSEPEKSPREVMMDF